MGLAQMVKGWGEISSSNPNENQKKKESMVKPWLASNINEMSRLKIITTCSLLDSRSLRIVGA